MKWAIYGDADSTASYNPRTARAFCEGRKAAADGELITANPFTAGIEDENLQAWSTGWGNYQGSPDDKGYCAV